MSRSRTTLAITALTALTITFPAPAGYRDYSKAISISGGEDHTLVATANNRSWACGPNGHRVGEVTYYYGVLGTASNDPDLEQKVLVRIHGAGNVGYLEGICDIAAGWQHSLALDVNDSVWSWGWNSKGQLGVGDDQHRTTPVQVFRGDQAQDPCQPSAYLKHIIGISAGRSGEHSLAVDANGYAYAWGYNKYGQCGNAVSGDGERELTPVHVDQGEQPNDPCDPNNWLKHIIAVSAAQTHSMALEAIDVEDPNYDGKVYTFGSDSWPTDYGNYTGGSGKLGVGDSAGDSNTPVCVHRGEQDYNDPNQVYLKHIVAISAGWDHSVALEQYDVYDPLVPNFDPNHKGRVYTWGNNGAGWGDDGSQHLSNGGRLGNGSATDGNSTPVLVLRGEQPAENPNDPYPYLSRIMAVSAGEAHSMALDVNGCVYTWGDNQHGQVGDGTNEQRLSPVKVVGQDRNRNGIHDANEGYLENIVAISAGYWHSLAIDANGTIWTWGKGSAGRLGLGNKTIDCNTPHPIPVVYNVTRETFAFAIQTAIDGANDVGDILEASPGTYYEDVDFLTKTITLRSADPNNAAVVEDTVIQGSGGWGVPAVEFTANPNSTLSGFTIANDDYGIKCDSSSPCISNSVIANCGRHGLYCLNNSALEVKNCTISGNGGGVNPNEDGINCSSSEIIISNCAINDNAVNGIYCNGTTLELTNCIIENNHAHGIYDLYSTVVAVIANNIVRANAADGICAERFSSGPEIANNWIYDNAGSGIKTYNPSAPPDTNAAIVNNTIVNNDEYGVESDYAADAEIASSIIWNNGSNPSDNLHATNGVFSVAYSCIEGGYAGTGNITSDPCFVDVYVNDFHLAADSPCIDTGDPDFEADPNETDIDGGPRIINERVDMGADEFWASDFNRDGLVNFIDYAMLTSYWQDAGVDYNDVFLYGDSNSVGLKQFCDEWLRGGESPPGPMPLMAGGGGGGMGELLSLQAAPSELTAVEEKALIAEPVDVEKLLDWLAEIWLDPEVREQIDAEDWLKLYESLKDLEPITK